MDSEASVSHGLRRSTRLSTRKALDVELTARGPLKRTKKSLVNAAPTAAVNGSTHVENGTEDEESPSKKIRLQSRETFGSSGDENTMDIQESVEDLEKNEDHDMDIEQTNQGDIGDFIYYPRAVLGEHRQTRHALNDTRRVKPTSNEPAAPTRSVTQIRPHTRRQGVSVPRTTTMDEYKRKMTAEVRSTAIPRINHHMPSVYPASEISYTTRQRGNTQTLEPAQHKKQVGKKTAVRKKCSPHSSRGFMCYFWSLVLLLALCYFTFLLSYNIIPVLRMTADDADNHSKDVNLERFADHLIFLETQFLSQRPEVWRWIKIHLGRHLNTAEPTEPVSLILVAGVKDERTLRCLAQRLAFSFSSALNASALHIDGTTKANQSSDEVTLDLYTHLEAAFKGDKPVAVIHRLEELPPGSTLIFYRYCDHQTAAYKRVFLLFTVLLPQDEIMVEQKLIEVEEMVFTYLRERLVGAGDKLAHNEMDGDKFGGLWSRIAHVVLPVVSETEVEQRGCL